MSSITFLLMFGGSSLFIIGREIGNDSAAFVGAILMLFGFILFFLELIFTKVI